jgi:mRNA interferase RelE/StbE
MAAYHVTISKSAQKRLDKLSDGVANRLITAIYTLADDPRPNGCKKLKGRDAYRIRVGDYRIIYEIFDNTLIVSVIDVGDRKDIYN